MYKYSKSKGNKKFFPTHVTGVYQEGGDMVSDPNAVAGDPAAGGGGEDPMQQLIMAAQQATESGDCQVALQVCGAIVQLASQGAEGGAPAPGGAPV